MVVVDMQSLIVALFGVSFAAAICFYLPVLTAVSKEQPSLPLHSLRNKFAVDPYVWSNSCSQSLRRRYVISWIALCVAMLCGSFFGWNASLPASRPIAVLCVLAAGWMSLVLVCKLLNLKRS
jgi:hypothetical protein